MDARGGGRRFLALGVSRPSWFAADGTRMCCVMSCETTSWSTWRAMTRFLSSMRPGSYNRAEALWGRASIHRLGGQDHQLPDRRIRRLCLMPRPRLYRSRAVFADGLDRRPYTDKVGACADGMPFATKPSIIVSMVKRAVVPFAWVAADRVYATNGVEMTYGAPAAAMCLG
jgi:hypothetical protein